jgi:hypothetical protein
VLSLDSRRARAYLYFYNHAVFKYAPTGSGPGRALCHITSQEWDIHLHRRLVIERRLQKMNQEIELPIISDINNSVEVVIRAQCNQ